MTFDTVEQNRGALQKALKERLGITVRKETRLTDVLLLKVARSNAPGLKQVNNIGSENNFEIEMEIYDATNEPLSEHLVPFIESQQGIPVIDKTGLSGRYEIHMKYKSTPDGKEVDSTSLQKALYEQLGLEVVPAIEPVEMLVVERDASASPKDASPLASKNGVSILSLNCVKSGKDQGVVSVEVKNASASLKYVGLEASWVSHDGQGSKPLIFAVEPGACLTKQMDFSLPDYIVAAKPVDVKVGVYQTKDDKYYKQGNVIFIHPETSELILEKTFPVATTPTRATQTSTLAPDDLGIDIAKITDPAARAGHMEGTFCLWDEPTRSLYHPIWDAARN
jgi:hypothetical protein